MSVHSSLKISTALTLALIPALAAPVKAANPRKPMTTSAAAPARKAKAPVAVESETHEAAHEENHDSGSSSLRMGAGFSTLHVASNTLNTLVSTPSLSALFLFGGNHSVQATFAIDGTATTFRSSFGGFYRYTLAGGQASGFHAGGGIALGTVQGATGTAFAIEFGPMMGFHYQVPHAPVQFSLDGGPALAIIDGAANFQVGTRSPLLGVSAHYLF